MSRGASAAVYYVINAYVHLHITSTPATSTQVTIVAPSNVKMSLYVKR